MVQNITNNLENLKIILSVKKPKWGKNQIILTESLETLEFECYESERIRMVDRDFFCPMDPDSGFSKTQILKAKKLTVTDIRAE